MSSRLILLVACLGCHLGTARPLVRPLAHRAGAPTSALIQLELPFLKCTVLPAQVDFPMSAGPRSVVREVVLETAGAIARIDLLDTRHLQTFWSMRDAPGLLQGATLVTEVSLVQDTDDELYPESTPWALDGVWSEGVLFHREANESGCQLFWAPRGGDVKELHEPCGYGNDVEAAVIGGRLIVLSRAANSFVGDARGTAVGEYGLDGAAIHPRERAGACVVIANVVNKAALATLSQDGRTASLVGVGSQAAVTVDIDVGRPPHLCGVEGAGVSLLKVRVNDAKLDIEVAKEGACVRRFTFDHIVVISTMSGLIGFDATTHSEPQHQHPLRCVTTTDIPPSD